MLSFLLVFFCENNPSNSYDNNEDEITPACNADVEIIIEREDTNRGYSVYYFDIAINNIGDINIIEAGAKFRVSFPDYTTSNGTIYKSGFSLPPGANYTYNAQIGPYYPVNSKTYRSNGILEVYDIYYSCF